MPANLADAMIRLLDASANEGLTALSQILKRGQSTLGQYGQVTSRHRMRKTSGQLALYSQASKPYLKQLNHICNDTPDL